MHEIQIDVHPRVHLGLISMHADAPRVNGGIGFAVDGPSASIVARRDEQFSLADCRPMPMAAGELGDLGNILKTFAAEHSLPTEVSFEIRGEMRTHVGMGSATGIRLGALECLSRLHQFECSNESLVVASGRGGTSGVGIKTYFRGGFICDLGRANDDRAYGPSSHVAATSAPLALPALEMDRWPVLLIVPRNVVPKTQREEVEFFERTIPLPEICSYETSYIALFEIYAAVAECDYRAFCRGVNRMQRTAWKKAERNEYGDALQLIAESLRVGGADCVGMSSLGPMLFCFIRPEKVLSFAKIAEDLDCDVYQTMPRNEGRTVKRSHA